VEGAITRGTTKKKRGKREVSNRKERWCRSGKDVQGTWATKKNPATSKRGRSLTKPEGERAFGKRKTPGHIRRLRQKEKLNLQIDAVGITKRREAEAVNNSKKENGMWYVEIFSFVEERLVLRGKVSFWGSKKVGGTVFWGMSSKSPKVNAAGG